MKKLILFCIFALFVSRTYADDYYWVGGAGSWSDLNHWASVSGGAANKSIVPGTGDDVYFDANSGLAANMVVTMPTAGHAYCRNMSWAGVTAAAIFRNTGVYQLHVYGNLELSGAVKYAIMTINFTGSSNATYRTNGAVRIPAAGLYNSFIVNKPGGSLTLLDGIVGGLAVQNLVLTAGTLDMSGQTHTFGNFSGNSPSARTLNITNSTIVVTQTWDTRGSNMTLIAAGSSVTSDMFHSTGLTFAKVFPGRNNPDMDINSNTFEELTFTSTVANTGTLRIGSNNTIGRLEFKGGGRLRGGGNVIGELILAPGKGYIFHGNNTINTLIQANTPDCDALGELRGADANAVLTFGAGATADVRNVLITSLTAAGSITPITVVGVDGGDNTGWTILPRSSGSTTLYWVGGAGEWSDKAHWSATSGGPGGACVPFMTDDVVFDANSGFTGTSNTVSLTGTAWCHDMTWTNVTGSPVLATSGYPLEIWGSVVLDPTLTLSAVHTTYVRDVIRLKGTEASTFTTNGCNLGNPLFNLEKTGTDGGITITDDINFPACSLRVASGKFLLPGRTVNVAEIRSQATTARTIDITNATIAVNDWVIDSRNAVAVNTTGSFITVKTFLVTNGFSYPKIYCDAFQNSVNITGTTIDELVFTNTSLITDVTALSGNGGNTIGTLDIRCGGVDFRGTNTINNLLLAPSRTYYFRGTQTITGLFRFNSPDCNGLGELRDLDGTPAILNFGPSSTQDFNNVYLQNMTATGSGVPISVSGADAGGNTGFNITPSAAGPRYWVGGSGDWNESAHWSTTSGGAGGACVPTVSNDVFFDAGSFTSGSSAVTISQGNAYCRNMDWTGASNAPTFTKPAGFDLEIWGNLVMSPAVNPSIRITFAGPANATFTPNNASQGNLSMYIEKPAGSSLTFLGDYDNANSAIDLRNGGLNLNGRTITAYSINDNNVNEPTSIDIRNANITGRWQYTGANKSLQAAGSHITASLFRATGGVYNSVDVITGSSTYIGISQTTIADLIFSNAAGTSQAYIAPNNTIGRLEFKGRGLINGTGNTIDTLIFAPGKTYTFLSGSNTTITKAWFGSGTPCNLTEITSTVAGSPFTVTKTAGTVEFDYVRLRNITAAGITPFKALEHSEDLGNNTNWDIAPYDGSTPILGLGPDITLCAEGFPYTLNTNGFFASPLASFTWNDGSTAQTLVVNGPGTYSVTVSYPDGCTRTDDIVIIRSTVTVDPVTGDAAICDGETTTLASATPGGVWTTSDAAVATVSSTGLVTGIAPGTATISYTITNGDGCTGAQQLAVTVNAVPAAPVVNGTLSLFEGGTTTLSSTTPGGAWTSSDAAVATVDGSGVVTGVAGGSADITYTVTNASGCTSFTTVTVTVDGFSPAKRVLAVTRTGDAQEPGTNGGFSVHLPAGALAVENITITYTIGGTATAPGDHAALSGTVTIPAGQNGAAVPVIVQNDTQIEAAETVIVTLSGGTSANYAYTIDGAGDNATVQIADDDDIPANRVLSVTAQLHANEPSATGTFTISLPSGTLAPEDVTVTYTVGGTAASGVDYEALPVSAVIPAGQNKVVIDVKAIDDQVMEKTKTITLTLTGGTTTGAGSFTISTTQGTAVLNQADDDYVTANRLLSVTANGNAAEPSTHSSFTISLPAGYTSSLPITVSCTISGTATNGADYNGPATSITLPAGQNSVTVPVNVVDDGAIETTESVILTVTGGVAVDGATAAFAFSADAAASSATVNIADDDNTSGNRTVSVTAQNAAEPATNGNFTISLPAGVLASEDIAIAYSIGAGTATPGTDYRAITGSIVIPAGSNSVQVALTVIDNTVIEPTETVIFNVTGATSTNLTYTVSATNGSATASIADNDLAAGSNIVLLTKVSDAIEGGGNGQYRISFPPGVSSSEDVVVGFSLSGTAKSVGTGKDYSLLYLSGSQIVIPAGADKVIIDVDASNDGIIEGPEDVILTLTSAASASYPFSIDASANSATVQIIDANAASSTPLQVLAGANASEPSASGTFTLKLAGVATSAWPVTVGYSLSGSATPGADYTLTGSVVIPASTNSITVSMPVVDDQIIEKDETVTITLLSGSATDGGGNAFIFPPDPANNHITVTIADDDDVAANQVLKVAPYADAAEPVTNGSFTVSLPAGYSSAANTTLSYTMIGTATRNTDYTIFTITLPAYQNSISLPVFVTDDGLIEGAETAILKLNGATDGNSLTYTADPAADQATVNIADDDDVPANRQLSISTGLNGAEPGTDGAVKIKLINGAAAAHPITVNYTISGGTATDGLDYDVLTGTAVIPAGLNEVTVPVTIKDDDILEQVETVVLTLTGGTGGGANTTAYTPAAGSETASMFILDDDDVPANRVLNITPGADVTEGGAAPVEFTISLPGAYTSAEDITVSYTVDGAAQAGSDYTALSGSVVIPAGQHSVVVSTPLLDDQLLETPEPVRLTLNGGTSANATFTGAGDATVTILDDDNQPANLVLSIAKTADASEPGISGGFRVSLPAGILSPEDITVNYTIAGTATAGADYTTLTGSVVIPAGQGGVDVPVNVINDFQIESAETVVVTLAGGTSTSFTFTGTGSATASIADDESGVPANKALTVAKDTDGAEPLANGGFIISLPTGITSTEDVTVTYTTGGSATAGDDYAALTGSVVIPAGQNSISVPVTVSDDQTMEAAETVILTLTGGSSPGFVFTGGGSATVNIADDESALPVAITIAKNADGAEPATNGSFIISLPAGVTSTKDVTVNYTVSGTADENDDYTVLTGQAVIPSGQNRVSVPVTVADDGIIETIETVTATLTDANATGFTFTATGDATVNISDDDNTPANRVLGITKLSDASEPFSVGRVLFALPTGIAATENITVNYTVAGSATEDADYAALSGSATIIAGDNGVLVPVSVIDDQLIESLETVTLTLTGGGSTSFAFTGAGNVTVNITDDDNTPANLVLNVTSSIAAAEPDVQGRFTISLPDGITATSDIAVTYAISGNAAADEDYTGLAGLVVIPAGSSSVDVPVDVVDDELIEGDEDIMLTLTGGTAPGLTFAPGASPSATMTLADDDNNLDIVVNATMPAASEPSPSGAFTISLASGKTLTADLTVTYAISGTATPGGDYAALTGTAVIPAGSSSVIVPVTVLNDELIEQTENVTLTLTGGAAYTLGSPNAATVNITDDDVNNLRLEVTASKPNAAEPAVNGEFTISIVNGKRIAEPVTIQYTIGGTATAGGDYQAITGTVTIPANQNSITVPVTVIDDEDVEDPETVSFTISGGQSASFAWTPGAASQAEVTITSEDVALGDLVITKEIVQPLMGPYRLGQEITYRITVRNIGNGLAGSAAVTDTLPVQLGLPGMTRADRGQVNVAAANRMVVWSIGDMQPGAMAQLEIRCRITEGGAMVATAEAVSGTTDPDLNNNKAVMRLQIEGSDLSFPNVITPNGDGKNEKFIIGGLEKYPGSRIQVFNRWGSQVYRSNDYRNDWNGADLNESTYYYILEVNKPGGIKTYKGWVMILR